MEKWLTDGLIIGLMTAAVGGGVSILLPNQSGAILMGSTLGAITGSAIVSKREEKGLTDRMLPLDTPHSVFSPPDLSKTPLAIPTESTASVQPIESTQLSAPLSAPLTTAPAKANNLLITLSHKQPEEVIAWFETKKIGVESYRHPDPLVDKIFNKQALFLGKNYHQLAPFLKHLKWAISQNRGIQFHLKNANQSQIAIQTQFCNNLLKDTLLSSYRYSRNDRTIHAAIQDRADIRSFFNGEWFERFIAYKICRLIQDLNLDYAYLMNPIIRFPNGDSFELDIFFLIGDQPLLIECKTGGNVEAHLKKFANHRKRLSMSSSHAFLIILDLEDEQAEKLSQFWEVTMTNQDNFIALLQAILQNS